MNANANASFFGNLRGKSGPSKEAAASKPSGRGPKSSIPVFEDKVPILSPCTHRRGSAVLAGGVAR